MLWPRSDRRRWLQRGGGRWRTSHGSAISAPHLGCILREQTRGLLPQWWEQRVLPHGAASRAMGSVAESVTGSPDPRRLKEWGEMLGLPLATHRLCPCPLQECGRSSSLLLGTASQGCCERRESRPESRSRCSGFCILIPAAIPNRSAPASLPSQPAPHIQSR